MFDSKNVQALLFKFRKQWEKQVGKNGTRLPFAENEALFYKPNMK